MIRVRERGKFWLRELYLHDEQLTIVQLRRAIERRYSDQPERLPIYSMNDLWDSVRTPLETDQQLLWLVESTEARGAAVEIEIIFEFATNPERHSYTRWLASHPQASR